MGLRSFNETEIQVLRSRLQQTWASLRCQEFPDEVTLPALLQGFGTWVRVAAPVTEPLHRSTYVLLRCKVTDDYALVCLPGYTGESVGEEDLDVLLVAAQNAVVGDFLRVWKWALNLPQPLTNVAMTFLHRLPRLSAETQFLAAFSLVEETYRSCATAKRNGLHPLETAIRAQVDSIFWEASEPEREKVAQWADEEVDRFLRRLPDQVIAEDNDSLHSQVEYLVEVFLEQQVAVPC